MFTHNDPFVNALKALIKALGPDRADLPIVEDWGSGHRLSPQQMIDRLAQGDEAMMTWRRATLEVATAMTLGKDAFPLPPAGGVDYDMTEARQEVAGALKCLLDTDSFSRDKDRVRESQARKFHAWLQEGVEDSLLEAFVVDVYMTVLKAVMMYYKS